MDPQTAAQRQLDPDNLLRASLCGFAVSLCGNTDRGDSSVAKEARRRTPERRFQSPVDRSGPISWVLSLARGFASR
jgi:hypothetical protein